MDPPQPSRIQLHRLLDTLLLCMAFCALLLVILLAATYHRGSHPPGPGDSIALQESSWPRKWGIVSTYLNGFSFFSAVCGLLVSVSCGFSHLMLPISEGSLPIEKEVAVQRTRLARALAKMVYVFIFLMLSIAFCAVGYVCSGLSAAGERRSQQLPVIITFAVGGFVGLQAFFVSVKDLLELLLAISESHPFLWSALKRETPFGMVFTKCVEVSYGRDSPPATAD